jgi:hypothetical protein
MTDLQKGRTRTQRRRRMNTGLQDFPPIHFDW